MVTEGGGRKKKLCRVPERCQEMQLNRRRTHASTTITTSESSSGGGSREGRGWNIEERDRESESERERGGGDALSAAETLHHRLPRWEGGREGGWVGEWTEEGRCSFHQHSFCHSV